VRERRRVCGRLCCDGRSRAPPAREPCGENCVSSSFFCTRLILKPNDSSRFNPTLPDWKLEALAQVKAGDGFKVHIKLNKRVFPPDMHGIVCAGCMFPEIWVDSSGKKTKNERSALMLQDPDHWTRRPNICM